MTASLSERAALDSDPRLAGPLLVGAPRAPFSLAVSRALGTVVVTCHGPLDDQAVPRLSAILSDLIEAQGNLEVVLDLRDAELAGATDLTLLEVAAGWAAARRGRLRICVGSEAARAPLVAAGLGALVELVTPARLARRHVAG